MQSRPKGIMKKILTKIRRRKKEQPEAPSRITAETIAEHREQVLAGGRRFKYPIQYARHKLVINAIIVSITAVILLIIFGWWQLYHVQNSGDFMYRVTRVLPLPVASVDGYQVRYSDYLMKYRSSIHYLSEKEQVNFKTEDGQLQQDTVKHQAIRDAVADAYAAKIASEQDIVVSESDVDTFIQSQRISPDGEVSQATYDAVVLDYYGWSPDEYRHAMKAKLLRQQVAYAIDAPARERSDRVAARITEGQTDLKKLADNLNEADEGGYVFVDAGWVPRTNQDGGVTLAADGLEKGNISAAIQPTTGAGYYFIKLVDTNETHVRYQYIQVPLSVFQNEIEALFASDKVQYYITLRELEGAPAEGDE